MRWMKKPYDTLTSLIFTQKSKLMEAKQMKTATIELNLSSNFVLNTATSVNINFLLFNFKMIIKDKSSEIGSASRSPAYRYILLLAGFDDYAFLFRSYRAIIDANSTFRPSNDSTRILSLRSPRLDCNNPAPPLCPDSR